jgi:CarD family transcriptional regulator
LKRKGDGMFKVGEYVVYGNTGVCKVEDITTMDMVGTEKEYYVLVPVYNKNGRAFLPVDNTKVVIRPVLTKDEALKLIDTIPQIEEIPPVNDKGREERYKELAKACDCRSWVTIIKTIYIRRQERMAQGKKVTSTDERYFKLAEDSLYSELGFAMNMDKEDISDFIKERIDA